MKKYIFIAAMALSLLALASCEKYEDGRPSKAVRNEFKSMYPDARDIEWEVEAGYWAVSFETGKAPDVKERTAWYDAAGNWIRTKTEIPVSALPQEIKNYISGSSYAGATIADVDADYYETPSGNFYRLDIIYDGVKMEIDVSEDGKVTVADVGVL